MLKSEKVVSLHQAVDDYEINERILRRAIADDELRAGKVGRQTFLDRRALEEWILKQGAPKPRKKRRVS